MEGCLLRRRRRDAVSKTGLAERTPVDRSRLAITVQPNPLNGEAPRLEPQMSALVRLISIEPSPSRPLSVHERPLLDAQNPDDGVL